MRDHRDRAPIRAAFDDDFARITERLRRADATIEPSEELRARIDEALAIEAGEQRRRWLGSFVAAAAVLAAALTAWWVAGGGRSVTPPAPSRAAIEVAAPSRVPTRLDFAPGSPLFERTIESSRPNISIHFIYRSAAPAAPVDAGDGGARRPSSQGASA